MVPPKLTFNILEPNKIYKQSVSITNAGLDTARFSVKQPQSKNVRVVFTPGPIAPGMSVRLDVEVVAGSEMEQKEEFRIDSENEFYVISIIINKQN